MPVFMMDEVVLWGLRFVMLTLWMKYLVHLIDDIHERFFKQNDDPYDF